MHESGSEQKERWRLSRGRARLTKRGWAWIGLALLLLTTGYLSGRLGFLHVGYLLAALPAVAWIALRIQRPRLEASRRFAPDVVEVGQPTQVTVRILNRGMGTRPPSTARELLPWPLVASPSLQLPSIGAAAIRAAVPGGIHAATVRYTIRPPQRGIVDIGPLVAEFRDPFGLVTMETDARRADRLVVTPAVEELADSVSLAASGHGDRMRSHRQLGGSDDEHVTREYRAGDPFNRVHWRVSARHGELMVRQEERRSRLEARIVLETRRSAYRDAGEDGRDGFAFEWAVRMVAALDAQLAGVGFETTVIETAAAQLAAPRSSLLVGLAGIHLVEAHADKFQSGPMSRGDRHGPVFAVLSDPDTATTRWLSSMPRDGGHAVAFVLDWRSRATEALERAGWACVPVTPTTRLADAWARMDRDVVRR